ncbi:MAG: hypothetical protein ACTHWH_16720 [Marinobacter sp.]
MKNLSKLFFLIALYFFCSGAQAHEGCVKDSVGQPVCAPPNGGIAKDRIGQVVCGLGQCIKDSIGQVVCSNEPGGFATKNSIGQAVCSGGCSQAAQSKCEKPR